MNHNIEILFGGWKNTPKYHDRSHSNEGVSAAPFLVYHIVNPRKLEHGFRRISARIPYLYFTLRA